MENLAFLAIVFLVTWLCFAIIPTVAARSRGRSGFGWFLISIFMTPLFALILVLVLPNLRQERLLKSLAGRQPEPLPKASLGGKASRVTIERTSQTFIPDGVYVGTPYRSEESGAVTAMMSGAPVQFRSIEQFQAAIDGKTHQIEYKTDN